jgi:hypothetical protein
MQNEERMQKIEQQIELIKSKVQWIHWVATFFLFIFCTYAVIRILGGLT